MFQGQYGNDFGGTTGTQFGAGGGFVPSQAQETTPGLKKFGNTQTLRAVTIKQISEAVANTPDDIICVDGEELSNITLVGRVVRVSETATNLDLLIDDGTGTLEAKLYVDSEEEQNVSKKEECRQGKYVRIHGHLRPMDGKYPLVAFNIRQISDFNEVTYHLLSCIYQHGHFTRGAGKSNVNAPMSNQKPAMGSSYNAAAMAQGDGPSDPFQRAIQDVFNSASKDFSSIEIREALGGNHDIRQIREAIHHLADEGHVYSTTDDKWKSCIV